MLSRFEQFTFMISSIYRSIQKIEREEMDKYGLKGGYAQHLAAMARHPEGLTAAQLCEICDLDKAAVSRSLTEMEQRGLLERDMTAGAYRAKLRLTSTGREAADYVRKKACAAVEAAGKDLSDGDRAVLYTALESIAGQLQTIAKEGLPD